MTLRWGRGLGLGLTLGLGAFGTFSSPVFGQVAGYVPADQPQSHVAQRVPTYSRQPAAAGQPAAAVAVTAEQPQTQYGRMGRLVTAPPAGQPAMPTSGPIPAPTYGQTPAPTTLQVTSPCPPPQPLAPSYLGVPGVPPGFTTMMPPPTSFPAAPAIPQGAPGSGYAQPQPQPRSNASGQLPITSTPRENTTENPARPPAGNEPAPSAPPATSTPSPDSSSNANTNTNTNTNASTNTNTPPASPTNAPSSAPSDAGSSFSPDAGGLAGRGGGSALAMVGDLSPIAIFRAAATLPGPLPPPTPPPTPPDNGGNGNGGNRPLTGVDRQAIAVKIYGLKIAENQSPQPQDRIFYQFNFYDNINGAFNARQGLPISKAQVFQNYVGVEKTFLDGAASFGVRAPFQTLKLNSPIPGIGGTTSSWGDLSAFFKMVVLEDNSSGSLISAGVSVTPNTGPAQFAGSPIFQYMQNTNVQPFIGYIFRQGPLFLHGFTSVDVPLDKRDVVMMFNDIGLGYYLYQAQAQNQFLTAIIPTVEAHINTPLNHRGFSLTDIAGTPDVINITAGLTIELIDRVRFTAAYVTPVTGPKPFDYEVVGLVNIDYGARRNRDRAPGIPPVIR